ncbi:amidohydrolase, partial [Providencia manganoxydans]
MSVSLEQLIKWRREFHQYPEIGWSEFLTTAKIVKVLRGLGLEVKVGP